MNKRKIGKTFEDLVSKHLKEEGFTILGQNFTMRGGEIDIIAQELDEIVFVEVKSLSQNSYISLEETISQSKKKHLMRSCQIWLEQNNLQDASWRIDFVGIKFDSYDKITSLKHIRNAVY